MCPTLNWLEAVKSDIFFTWHRKSPEGKPRPCLGVTWKIVLIAVKIFFSPLRGHVIKSRRNAMRTRMIESMLFWLNVRAEIIGQKIAAQVGTVNYNDKATCGQCAHLLFLAKQNLIKCESEVKRQTDFLARDLRAQKDLFQEKDVEGCFQKIITTYVCVVADRVDCKIAASVFRINRIRTFRRLKMRPYLAHLCNQLSILSSGVHSEMMLLRAIEIFYEDAATLCFFAQEEKGKRFYE